MTDYNGVGYDSSLDIRKRLQFIINKIIPTRAGELSATNDALSSAGFATYIAAMKTDITKRTPQTAEVFFDDIISYNGGTPPSDFRDSAAYSAMLADFTAILNYGTDGAGISTTYSAASLFEGALTKFLQTFEFPTPDNDLNPGAPVNTRDYVSQDYFMEQWRRYLDKVAFFKEGSVPGGLDLSYEQIYEAYFPENDTALDSRILGLISDMVEKNGYFLPSHNIGDFLTTVSQAYAAAISGQKSGASDPTGPNVLIRILHLLISMIDTVQQVATAQANRLGVLTSWQKNYTDLMGEVRSFVKMGPEGPDDDQHDGDHTLTEDNRKSLNDANNIYTPTLQSRRQVISDDAKALQSAINLSQDTVQNEASTVSSFLQQLSSILGAIYR